MGDLASRLNRSVPVQPRGVGDDEKGHANTEHKRGEFVDLVAQIRRLLALAERDPERACAEFDLLVTWYGRGALSRALREVAGGELAQLGL